jgi:hypothetical protein
MSSPIQAAQSIRRHPSPPLGIVAIAYAVLFCAGLYPVTMFGGMPYYPGPWESIQTITAFFQARPTAVLLCAFLQFGSAIPLGIFTSSAVSRLKFLGVKAAGAEIALFGGFATAISMMIGTSLQWALTRPAISHNAVATEALYYIGFGIGGPGFSVPFGLLIAGLSVPVLAMRLTRPWIPILGLTIALCGELSWLNIMFPQALPLIPLTRFPGFLWLIALGFALPTTRAAANPREVRNDSVA